MNAIDLVNEAVEILREGHDVVLGDGDVDYACADMLEILAALHDTTGIDLEGLPQVTEFARLIVGPACRECGCTTHQGCAVGCWWVEVDLCSACVPARQRASRLADVDDQGEGL